VNYAAPLQVYGDLSSSLLALPSNASPAIVCVGKEWYRFPSSFFLPEERFRLSFVHDGPVRTLVHSFTASHDAACTMRQSCLALQTDCGSLVHTQASQLPQPYSRERGTSVAPPNMNDQNREEPSRYVSPDTCDYMVELLLNDGNAPEHALNLQDDSAWEIVSTAPYLDAAQSPLPWRYESNLANADVMCVRATDMLARAHGLRCHYLIGCLGWL
jgi:alpha-1,2-mannosyltransferase